MKRRTTSTTSTKSLQHLLFLLVLIVAVGLLFGELTHNQHAQQRTHHGIMIPTPASNKLHPEEPVVAAPEHEEGQRHEKVVSLTTQQTSATKNGDKKKVEEHGGSHDVDDDDWPSLIGNEEKNCKRPPRSCRLCRNGRGGRGGGGMALDNSDIHVSPIALEYIKKHVLFGVITGSFEKFFRMDLAFCTWLGHVPEENVFVYTDRANTSDNRPGSWVESSLPAGVTFSKKQLNARGYTIDWIKAQYRFVQAILDLGQLAQALTDDDDGSGSDSSDGGRATERQFSSPLFEEILAGSSSSSSIKKNTFIRWVVIVDDDTFVNLEGLVRMLMDYDEESSSKQKNGEEKSAQNNVDEVNGQSDSETEANSDDANNHSGDGTPDDVFSPLSPKEKGDQQQDDRPLYLGERGWGGAGHYFNRAAFTRFVANASKLCVDRFMVKKFFASDVMLKRCMPLLGVRSVNDRRLSHCQANYLRERLLLDNQNSKPKKRQKSKPSTQSGVNVEQLPVQHVSSHIKRDVVPPRHLAMWRVRLYYQTIYHKNRTAYDLLMRVGACAYGSCKIGKCTKAHDELSVAYFVEQSQNNSFVPLL